MPSRDRGQRDQRRSRELTRQVLALKGTLCHLCRRPGATTADHLIPVAKGGLWTLDNLMPAHRSCNSARGDMDLSTWFALHPAPRREPLAPSRNW